MTNAQAWDYAVGMIRVDGLEPTKEFKEYIEKEKRGEVAMQEIKQYPLSDTYMALLFYHRVVPLSRISKTNTHLAEFIAVSCQPFNIPDTMQIFSVYVRVCCFFTMARNRA